MDIKYNTQLYKELLISLVQEIENTKVDIDLINKHKFELAIFPKKNIYKLGDKVRIYWGNYKPVPTGYIQQFNANGTLFIKMNEGDIGADYNYSMVEKI